MTRPQARGWLAGLMALLMLAGLAGCNDLAAAPPQEVVLQAVATQAQNNQATLWQQLSLQAETAPSLSVNQVKVRRTRPVDVASTIAYEVTGTYRYKIRYPNRRQVKQSQVPFTVILQAIPETEDWQLLRMGDGEGDRAWAWEPLGGDRA